MPIEGGTSAPASTGTVSSVSSANAGIAVATPTTTPVLTADPFFFAKALGLKDIQVFTPTASATWTKPASGSIVAVFCEGAGGGGGGGVANASSLYGGAGGGSGGYGVVYLPYAALDRKSTRLNSSHHSI